jgi:hypothetical protein
LSFEANPLGKDGPNRGDCSLDYNKAWLDWSRFVNDGAMHRN